MIDQRIILRPSENKKTRSWHGTAFVVESLILMLFLVASSVVIVAALGASYGESIHSSRLSSSVVLATNDAEDFSAHPSSDNMEYYYVEDKGDLRLMSIGINAAADPVETVGTRTTATGSVYKVTRMVEPVQKGAGILYVANIEVTCEGEKTYELETAHYVSGEYSPEHSDSSTAIGSDAEMIMQEVIG